jgi:hypothetical protein
MIGVCATHAVEVRKNVADVIASKKNFLIGIFRRLSRRVAHTIPSGRAVYSAFSNALEGCPTHSRFSNEWVGHPPTFVWATRPPAPQIRKMVDKSVKNMG